MFNFLKRIPFFATLPEADLEILCQMVEEVRLEAGQLLFAEGTLGRRAFVIKEGEVEILKASGGRELLLAIRGPGEVIGEMSLLESSPRMATVRARQDSLLLAIAQEQLEKLFDSSPSAARAMLHTIVARLRSTNALLQQSEKMAQLGTLTAGVAHELNNPAAAVQRGADQLREALQQWQRGQLALAQLNLTAEQLTTVQQSGEQAQSAAAHPPPLDPLNRSDQADEIETWLNTQGMKDTWNLAPTLVDLGYDPTRLTALGHQFARDQFPVILNWLELTHTVYSLLAEMGQGAGRIADIVKSLKSYAYLDQSPVQNVDIHEGLNNTLILLRHKLNDIRVQREYASNLPQIQAYGSELNQVWTNILDNAADALQGQGKITIRTRQEENWVVVEIEDNGPGIEEAIRARIFDPFFTTKPPGKGMGLGLNISYNIIVEKHRGDIKLFSRPGETCFQIWLPLDFESPQKNKAGVVAVMRPSNEVLKHILQTSKTIAVSGISGRAERPAHAVPVYLQQHGYRIVPVNPTLTTVLGEKAYPDLLSISEPVDLVLIFRRSEHVPQVVNEAIQIGAKTVWMQEGVAHEAAAAAAHRAGLNVIMNSCIRIAHKQFF